MTHKHEWATTKGDNALHKTCECGRTAVMRLTVISISPERDLDPALEALYDTLDEVLYSSGLH